MAAPPRGEIRHHLRRDLGRIGGDALRGDAMIAGEDQDLDPVEARRVAALPGGEPGDGLLQAPQAAGRLGQPRFARATASAASLVAPGRSRQAARKSAKEAKRVISA